MSRPGHTAMGVFAIPLVIGIASLLGLVLGLTGDGVRDILAWLLVGLAPLTIFAALFRRSSSKTRT